MAKQQHVSKSAHDVSTVPSAKLLQTRPFHNEHETEKQQSSQAQSVTGGWDLTKKILSANSPSTPSPTPGVGLPLQAKLTIGEPNDKYEQEADRVAHDVVQRINAPDTVSAQEAEDETSMANSAQQIQRQIAPPSMTGGFDLTSKWLSHSSPPPSTFGQPLQAKLTPRESPIQRETQEEDDELQMKPLLQRQVVSGDASSELESSINRARSGGQSLDAGLQQSMGQAMGADFSGVKVHTDSTADSLNQSIQAKAFTTGQDVFFRNQEYSPRTKSGQELIAHELTHVVQQTNTLQTKNQIQRYWSDEEKLPGIRVSKNQQFAVKGEKKIGATKDAITKANLALESANSLVRLQQGALLANYKDISWYSVYPTASLAAITGKTWKRIQSKEDELGKFMTFADCFRTSGVVAGFNPDSRKSKMVLKLTTGNVPVMSDLEANDLGVTKSPAAKAAASFLKYAIPYFVDKYSDSTTEGWTEIYSQLSQKVDMVKMSPWKIGMSVYKQILSNDIATKAFANMFGINTALAPEIGTALVQVGNEQEREEAVVDKWNYHWAGVILKDETDYATLENLAMELSEFNDYEKNTINGDIIDKKFLQKNDLINERWYFKLYGNDDQSFHSESLKDPHATPSGISLPLMKG